jgi:hypothetical protein
LPGTYRGLFQRSFSRRLSEYIFSFLTSPNYAYAFGPVLTVFSISRSALQQWTLSWQQTPESNLEPLDPNGPLPFTSSALLSLAYVRNCFDIFQIRKLSTWAPDQIAQVLQNSFPVDRKQNTLLAAYHAANLLSTLVKLGVQYFKHNQAVLWSIEAALCGLDCSIFLEKWFRRVQETMSDVPLTGM